jgi:hypothetical protein
MPPCGRADFVLEISCGATCYIWASRPATRVPASFSAGRSGCRCALFQVHYGLVLYDRNLWYIVAAGSRAGPLFLGARRLGHHAINAMHHRGAAAVPWRCAGAGCWVLGAGWCWALGAGRWVLGAGWCWALALAAVTATDSVTPWVVGSQYVYPSRKQSTGALCSILTHLGCP